MPIIADIKLKIDEFAAAMRRILQYFAEVGQAAKDTGKSIKEALGGSAVADAVKNIFNTKQKGVSDLFSGGAGKNIINILSGVTKAFQGGTFAAEGFVATGLNMVARALAILGPEFALVVAGVFSTAVAFKALEATIKFTTNSINEYQQIAAKAAGLGIQTKTLVVLQEAFKRVGGDAYAAATALDKFYANLYAAKDGATDVYNALRVLSKASGQNLLPTSLLKMSNEEALLKTISALQQVTNETQRLAIANKLFTGFTGTSGLYLKAIIDKSVIDQTKNDLSGLLDLQSLTGGGVGRAAEYFKGLFSIIATGAGVVGQVLGSMFSILPELESSFSSKTLSLSGGLQQIFVNIGKGFENLRPIIEFIVVVVYAVVDAMVQIGKIASIVFAGVSAAIKVVINLLLDLASNFATIGKYMTLGLVDFTPTIERLRKGSNTSEKAVTEPGALIPAFAPVQAAIASSLTKVGGGGESFGAGGNDPLYDISRQQLETQKQIRDALNRNNQQSTGTTGWTYIEGGMWQ